VVILKSHHKTHEAAIDVLNARWSSSQTRGLLCSLIYELPPPRFIYLNRRDKVSFTQLRMSQPTHAQSLPKTEAPIYSHPLCHSIHLTRHILLQSPPYQQQQGYLQSSPNHKLYFTPKNTHLLLNFIAMVAIMFSYDPHLTILSDSTGSLYVEKIKLWI
jgi:hypothetical protein